MKKVTTRQREARLRGERIDAQRAELRANVELEAKARAIVSSTLTDIESRRRSGTVLAGATYRGAESRPSWDGWNPRLRSPDEDLADDREKLVARCRDLARNNPIARALIETKVGHVIGGSPWSVQSITRANKLAGILTDQQVRDWKTACEDVWEEAVETIDQSGSGTLWEMLRLAYRAHLDGDAFLVIDRAAERTARRRIPVSLTVLEGDLCRTPQKFTQDRRVRLGVHYRDSSPEAYYLFDSYPDDFRSGAQAEYRKTWRDDKEGRAQVLHLMRALRPGQSRGLPWLAPAAAGLEDAGGYEEAEFMAARVSACISLIRKRSHPGMRPEDENVTLEPGGIIDSYQGETIEPFNPVRPHSQFAAYMERAEKASAAALGFSSMLSMRDFTEANYSVSRATMLDAWKTFGSDQQWLSYFVSTIYEAVIEAAWMDGLLPADVPLFDGTGRSSTITRELMRSAPIPPANGWIDPSVEIAAYVDAIKNNLTTKREVLSTLGRDWEQTFNDRAEEVQRESELGIAPPDSAVDAPAMDAPTPDDPDAPVDEAPVGEDGEVVLPEFTLNGAQVSAATAIVQSVAEGLIPRDSGIGQLMVLFNLTVEQAEQVMGSVGQGFVPTPKDSVPEPDGESDTGEGDGGETPEPVDQEQEVGA